MPRLDVRWSLGSAAALVCLVVGVATISPQAALAANSFYAPKNWSLNLFYGSQQNAVGDFNGDGKDDLVAWNSAETAVMLSTGTGFVPPAYWSQNSLFYGSRQNAVGDFNGDGKDDLVAWNDAQTAVALSTGSAFQAPQYWSNNSWFYGSKNVVGDVNGDSKDDLIAWNYAETAVALSSGAAFYAPQYWSQNSPFLGARMNQAGDFDGNCTSDLVATNDSQQTVVLSAATDVSATRCRYPTSSQYGGANRVIDTEAEADAVGQALASSANTPALWAGISPGDQAFVMDVQTPTFAVWGPRVDTRGPAALTDATIDEVDFSTRTADVSWEIGEDPELSPEVSGSGTTATSFRWRESDGSWRSWVDSDEFGFTLVNADPSDTFFVEIRERDVAGNWGPTNAATLQAPATSSEPRGIPVVLFLACVRFCPLAGGVATGSTTLARGTAVQVTRVTLKKLTMTPARNDAAAAAWRAMTTRGSASRRLRRNMINDGMGGGGGRYAHHIVPIGKRWSGRAQEIMKKCGIGPDDAANGVYLTRFQHAKTYTKPYAENLNRILELFEATCIGQPLSPFANIALKNALREVGDTLAGSALRMAS